MQKCKKMNKQDFTKPSIHKILVSRTDSIGDVVLTLPLINRLKVAFPTATIVFMGKAYTKPVIESFPMVDHFIDWSEMEKECEAKIVESLRSQHFDAIIHVFPNRTIARIAAKARIPIRVGTSHRWFHWLYCNRKVEFSRRKSDLHESQLNLKLLEGLGLSSDFSLQEIRNWVKLTPKQSLPHEIETLLNDSRRKVILHPKSKGSAREWSLENFCTLSSLLNAQGFLTFISGTNEDREMIESQLGGQIPHAIDLTGKLTLSQFITFISRCDALVAASTGPLHIAAILGIHAIGIFPPIRPMHPGRWAPIGNKTTVLCISRECSDCRKTHHCHCINEITPEQVMQSILSATENSNPSV